MSRRRVKMVVEFALRDQIEYTLFAHRHPDIQLDLLTAAVSKCPVFRSSGRTIAEEPFERIFAHIYMDKAGTRIRCVGCHEAYRSELKT